MSVTLVFLVLQFDVNCLERSIKLKLLRFWWVKLGLIDLRMQVGWVSGIHAEHYEN